METDRPLEIGNLRKKIAWDEHFPQIANRPCSIVQGDMALTDANPAFGPTERKPRMCPLEQGRTLGGCILGSDNMETDRPLEIGNLRKMFAWGAIFPQIANRPCPVCHGQSSEPG